MVRFIFSICFLSVPAFCFISDEDFQIKFPKADKKKIKMLTVWYNILEKKQIKQDELIKQKKAIKHIIIKAEEAMQKATSNDEKNALNQVLEDKRLKLKNLDKEIDTQQKDIRRRMQALDSENVYL